MGMPLGANRVGSEPTALAPQTLEKRGSGCVEMPSGVYVRLYICT